MIHKLEDIGFYTLSDNRAKMASSKSNIQRAEILLTDRCNFKCVYCRGVVPELKGPLEPKTVETYIELLITNGCRNIRFTGGEPTLYDNDRLLYLVNLCSLGFMDNIAISTNGSANLDFYEMLIYHGVTDFSISLDGVCCSITDNMSGIKNSFDKVVRNIKALSLETYVTLGIVFNELNVSQAKESVLFADSLGVSDIRIIPSAQYNKALINLTDIPNKILQKYPVLNYRLNNIKNNKPIRGLVENDFNKCPLVLDDLMIAGKYHYPCSIYMREQGHPIGTFGLGFRQEREEWFKKHDSFKDKICKFNCLDVCIEYNNKWKEYH